MQGEIGPDIFRAACNMRLEGTVSNIVTGRIVLVDALIGSRSRPASHLVINLV